MRESPTLSVAPPEHHTLDYSFLREEGIRYLELLAGHRWTDFNAHDPGITILEQLCFAITDLGYRAFYGVPDLLTSGSGDPYESLYSPATILTSCPVTLLDLRKLILDAEGVKNAWIEVVEEPAVPLFYHEGRGELAFQAEEPYTAEVLLEGLHRVLVEKSDLVDPTGERMKKEVVVRLHAHRPLCTDFEEVEVLRTEAIQVQAEVEIGAIDDAESVLLRIYEVISEHMSPSVRFSTLGEMLAAGKRSDEIFDGPRLVHGFLDSKALERMARKDAIYTSDLIREIMAVPGVRTVRNITVSAGRKQDAWRLPLDVGTAPRLDVHGSSIVLMKGQLTARLEPSAVSNALAERARQAASNRQLSPSDLDFTPPVGRDRMLGRYRSIQHEFPAIYGIGEAGLPDSAAAERKAQAQQLKAYLLFFDQLLANFFAQLAHAGSLFSFHEGNPRTYFAQVVDDPNLGFEEVRVWDAETHRRHLEEMAENEPGSGSLSNRKNRFLNHLMARFAEQFADYSLVLLEAASRAERSAEDKLAFLRRYSRISSARGTGFNAVSPLGTDGTSGLEERIVRKLGLSVEHGETFFLLEHVLLRPILEDNVPPSEREYRQIPVLSAARSKDPYSLQVSFVFPNSAGRLQASAESGLRPLVEQTIREETPAHLIAYILWLNGDEWQSFELAYRQWLEMHRRYRAAKMGLELMSGTEHFQVRDTRDRLIDLLGLGETYPLRDLPVRDERLTVPFNQPAQIPIEHSQRGVTYELRSDRDDTLIRRDEGGASVPARVEGNGGTVLLLTPPMRDDTTYNILARKIATGREAYLQQQATVKVGLDLTLDARILDAAPLDPNIEPPADDDPRIVAYGTSVRVQIDQAQEGVDYHLFYLERGEEKRLSEDVRGRLVGPIVLEANPVFEDLDLRIRATKVFDPSEHRETQTEPLEVVLPLKVRARLDLPVSLESSPADFGMGALVRLENTQASASYTLYLRAVSDSDFVFDPEAPGLLGADVEGEPRVYVRRPPAHPIWQDVDGFEPLGAPVPGNGGSLTLPTSALIRDSVILVRAQKEHRAQLQTIPSSVQLQQAVLLLVRPDPHPALELRVIMEGDRTTGTMEMTGGEPGVYYFVRAEAEGADLGLPAYFHKTDERNTALNKGIDQLRIEVDLAISRGTVRPATTPDELATTPPLSPLVETGAIEAGTTLYIRAMKAQTRVAIDLPNSPEIAALPEIVAEPAEVSPGSSANIVVRDSIVGERYELTLDGERVGDAQDGDGADLVFSSGALEKETEFEVVVTRLGDEGIRVERRVRVRVEIATER